MFPPVISCSTINLLLALRQFGILTLGQWYPWINGHRNPSIGRYIPFDTMELASDNWKASQDVKLPANPRHGGIDSM